MTGSELALACGLVLGSYLVGSLSPSVFLGRLLKGVDLREHGSGNPGTTNAFRVLGTPLGIAVLVADFLKGLLPVLLARSVAGPTVVVLCAMATILGHNYSLFLRGSGGKGVATGAGAVMAMTPVILGIQVAVFLVVLLVSRMVSLASLSATVLFPILVLTTAHPLPYDIFSLVGAAVVIYAHRGNVRRIVRGEEPRMAAPWKKRRPEATQ
jgi:glycerol-3-phosphate acyltransferase PlsY